MASIGENIKVLRLARGWTQEDLASRLHLTRQAVGHYESGRTVPDIDTCRRLAEVFGVELEVLLEGEGEPVQLPKWLWGLILGTAGLPLLVRSVIMAANQRFYPLYNAGALPEEQRLEIMDKHFALSDAANAVEAVGYLAFFAVLIVLVLWEVRQRTALPWRQKLVLLGLVAAVTVTVTFPFSLLDPVFTATDYLLPASFITFRCGIALLIAWLARKVQKR
jgi:transcriptional regulator with XRE-family HTH domain